MDAGQETIRIDAANRWDALDLVRRLAGFRAHIVQLSDRWIVCVRQDRDLDALTVGVLDETARWAADRHLDATVQLGDRSYAIHP
jgi:hypothetical protein